MPHTALGSVWLWQAVWTGLKLLLGALSRILIYLFGFLSFSIHHPLPSLSLSLPTPCSLLLPCFFALCLSLSLLYLLLASLLQMRRQRPRVALLALKYMHTYTHTQTHRQRRTHRHNPHITTARQKKKQPNCEIPCGLPTQIQIHLNLSLQQHGLRGYPLPLFPLLSPFPASHSFLAAISFQTEICCAQMAHKHFWHLPRREFKNLMPQQINT